MAAGGGTLPGIDAHGWDWLLWLAGKALAGRAEFVTNELARLHEHLLAPLGGQGVPGSVPEAVGRYLALRAGAENRYGVVVDRRLGDVVAGRLRDAGVLTPGRTGARGSC